VFLVEELPHPRFQRVGDDLYLDMRIPWSKSMSSSSGVLFLGMDGEEHRVSIPHAAPHVKTLINGAGMPIRQGSKVAGRGDLIIR
jgi:DnaJ family protein B protein 4